MQSCAVRARCALYTLLMRTASQARRIAHAYMRPPRVVCVCVCRRWLCASARTYLIAWLQAGWQPGHRRGGGENRRHILHVLHDDDHLESGDVSGVLAGLRVCVLRLERGESIGRCWCVAMLTSLRRRNTGQTQRNLRYSARRVRVTHIISGTRPQRQSLRPSAV